MNKAQMRARIEILESRVEALEGDRDQWFEDALKDLHAGAQRQKPVTIVTTSGCALRGEVLDIRREVALVDMGSHQVAGRRATEVRIMVTPWAVIPS